MKSKTADFALMHATVFDGDKTLRDQVIFVQNDTIIEISPFDVSLSLPEKQIDLTGLLATSGFIDIQLNGCGGVLFNTDISESTLTTMNNTNLKYGTTQFLPTLITSQPQCMNQAIELIDNLSDREKMGVLGLHLEGPFISPQKKGAHQEAFIRELDIETAHFLASHANNISVVTLAPENNQQAVIDCLTAAGIIVSIGHSNATYQQLEQKLNLGMATHLFNAMSPFDSREPGVVGYIFDHKPTAGIIADGIHVSYASVRIAHDILKDKLFLVTDAVTPAGTDIDEFDMAGIPAYVTNGKCHFSDGTIAGAAITTIDSIKNLITHVGLSREEALRMASLYPAKALGIEQQYGRLKAGYKANITLLDDHNDVHSVYQMGVQRV
ncbi:N-acetylglucosamine-6-phosphate deacetylase [Aliivibrio kagoshimensis]|uniref:N-acetylglucosamine-6-phosphate deacetylase n=1 Tax=Aliivibrio kagoshimensis TaxID=2910230 RepID=UPI003D0EB0E7